MLSQETMKQHYRGDIRKKGVVIASDSQRAIQALGSYILKSKLVLECLEVLKELAKMTKLTIVWIPGHEGLLGNENADALETAKHVLCECVAVARIRLKHFGKGFMSLNDLSGIEIKRTLHYMDEIDLRDTFPKSS